jgi:hypothetical protein
LRTLNPRSPNADGTSRWARRTSLQRRTAGRRIGPPNSAMRIHPPRRLPVELVEGHPELAPWIARHLASMRRAGTASSLRIQREPAVWVLFERANDRRDRRTVTSHQNEGLRASRCTRSGPASPRADGYGATGERWVSAARDLRIRVSRETARAAFQELAPPKDVTDRTAVRSSSEP